jgi:dienelactone hydrolase
MKLLLLRGLALALGSTAAFGQDPETLDLLVERFWSATTVEARAPIANEVIEEGHAFDAVADALRTQRRYSLPAPTGRLLRTRKSDLTFPYVILVPENYDPSRRYPVRFELHGGMGAPEWDATGGDWAQNWRPVQNQIVILPAGWWDAMWWEHSQALNFEAILREVRATWNIDENRVVLSGTSDGGAGVFFCAMRTPDRFAGFAGFVAPPDRLTREDFRPDGQMHVSNLFGARFLLVYGEHDKLVPLKYIEQYMELFEPHAASLEWYVLPGQGHDLRLPEAREQQFAKFLWGTVRDPLPDRLSWSTERTDRYARRSWLRIDALEPSEAKDKVEPINLLPRLGTSLQRRGPTVPRMPWGRVELERDGNRVSATTQRVKRFTVFLSPDEFAFDEPITVVVDGETRFEGRVEPSVATLLERAAVDDDRAMLFAAELTLEL